MHLAYAPGVEMPRQVEKERASGAKLRRFGGIASAECMAPVAARPGATGTPSSMEPPRPRRQPSEGGSSPLLGWPARHGRGSSRRCGKGVKGGSNDPDSHRKDHHNWVANVYRRKAQLLDLRVIKYSTDRGFAAPLGGDAGEYDHCLKGGG